MRPEILIPYEAKSESDKEVMENIFHGGRRAARNELQDDIADIIEFDEIRFTDRGSINKTELLKICWEEDSSPLLTYGYTRIIFLKFLVAFGANPLKLEEPSEREQRFVGHLNDFNEAKNFHETAKNLGNMEYTPKNETGSSNLPNVRDRLFAISIDGGGIRGMVSALILRVVSNSIFGHENMGDNVHWLAGTSTGSVLALALAVPTPNRFTPTRCMGLYWQLKDIIFANCSNIFQRILNRRQNAYNLEVALENIFEAQNFALTDILNANSNEHKPYVAVTALNVSYKPARLDIFKNYRTCPTCIGMRCLLDNCADRNVPLPGTLFREAARASSAAPTYFSHFTLEITGSFQNGEQIPWQYVDGGLSANCPVDVLIGEIDKYFIARGSPTERPEIIILSVGTGSKARERCEYARCWFWNNISAFTNLMISQVTGGDSKVLELAAIQCKSRGIEFFRLNPELINCVDLAECDSVRLINMLWETIEYLTEQGTQAEIERLRDLFTL